MTGSICVEVVYALPAQQIPLDPAVSELRQQPR